MEVYFVRHGRTDGNDAFRHQHPNTILNELGKIQATNIAKLLKKRQPTYLITSTYRRSIETAREIGRECTLIPETHPAFEELHRPEFLVGERILGKVTIAYLLRWFFGVKSASMHDGETHADFTRRLAEARRHLESLPENARVIVVSHAVFINFFLEHMCRPQEMSLWRACIRIVKILLFKNTGIIHVRFLPTKAKSVCGWQVIHGTK